MGLPLGGCGPSTIADCTVAHIRKGGRAGEQNPERFHGQVSEILLGSRENTSRTGLGKVVGGLFFLDGDTIPHASGMFRPVPANGDSRRRANRIPGP